MAILADDDARPGLDGDLYRSLAEREERELDSWRSYCGPKVLRPEEDYPGWARVAAFRAGLPANVAAADLIRLGAWPKPCTLYDRVIVYPDGTRVPAGEDYLLWEKEFGL